MAEVASAFVSLLPSARGFGSKLGSQINPELDRAGKTGGRRFGGAITSGLGAAIKPAIALLGAAAATSFLKGSIDEAREAQKVGALTENVIKSTGHAAKISAKEVGKLATAISNKTGVDDEAIQSGANLLLTFKNIKREGKGLDDVFGRATSAAADLAASGFGDIAGASKQLGKALNDPVKGITALGRAGVTFTDAQKKQIEGFVKANDLLSAQKIILKEVESQVGGAAAATATSGEKMAVAWGNLKEQIGTALLPVLDGVEHVITTKIIPAVSSFIRKIPGALDSVKSFFESVTQSDAAQATFDAMKSAVDGIKDSLSTAATKLGDIKDAVGSIDLNNLDGQKIGEQLGTALTVALKKLAKGAGKVADAFKTLFGEVDWVGIGITIGKQAPALLVGLAAGILNFDVGSLLQGLGEHWSDIVIALLAIAFAPARIGGKLAELLAKIPFVGRFLAQAVKWLNDLGSRLLSFGGDLLRMFWRGFSEAPIPGVKFVSRVLSAIGSLPGRVRDFISLLGVRIGVWALDAFERMGRGARSAAGHMLSFLGTLPRKAASALSGAASKLYDVGARMIQGLINGIKSAVKAVISAVTGVVSGAINKAKSLLHIKSPSRVFMEIGNNVGAGLSIGIDQSRADVASAATRLARSVSVPATAQFDAALNGTGGHGLVPDMPIVDGSQVIGYLRGIATGAARIEIADSASLAAETGRLHRR